MNFEQGRDVISLDGGGAVYAGKRYSSLTGQHDGYYLYSTPDSTAGNNVIAEIDFTGVLSQSDFAPGTNFAGSASTGVLDLSSSVFNQITNVDVPSDGETTAHVVLIDNVPSVSNPGLSDHRADTLSNFRDGQDKIAVDGGGTVYILDHGSQTPETSRTVYLLNSRRDNPADLIRKISL